MFLNKIFNKKTGIYISIDDIENLQVCVNLKKLNALIKVPKFQLNDLYDEQQQKDDTEFNENLEIVNIKWQEKRFSMFEINYYNLKENCKTDLHRKYNKMIKDNNFTEIMMNSSPYKIFTYVKEDKYEPFDKIHTNKLRKNIENYDCNINESTEVETDETINNRYKNLLNYESMHIMADIGTEVLLFTLNWRKSDGTFLIYPDFNDIENNPYYLEVDVDSRYMYHYCIQNISDQPIKNVDISKMSIFSELLLSNYKSYGFILPPKHITNIFLFFEITSAHQFESDNLHVLYKLCLPDKYKALNETVQTEGTTHSSWQKNGQFNYSHCFELIFTITDEMQSDLDVLEIYFEVVSIDKWNRDHTEGFTMLNIRLDTDKRNIQLACIREINGNFLYDKLERFFLGGRRIFDIKNFYSKSKEENMIDVTNRYGTKTKTTGLLNVKWNIIKQTNVDLVTSVYKNNRRSLNHKKDNKKSNLMTIDDVLASYHEARRRLQATEMFS